MCSMERAPCVMCSAPSPNTRSGRRAERIAHEAGIASHVAPLLRGAEGAARRPYHSMESGWDSARARLCPQDQSRRGKGGKGLENFSALLSADVLGLTKPLSVKKRR
jgi:hypothetical protein